MSIHIKPENRGKFNATKKRTGKTTEQLTHSKNPLTRKRAIFAQNARKWKHADGGNLYPYGGYQTTPLEIRDYGMEWNNKVDRLRAINQFIGMMGMKIGDMTDGDMGEDAASGIANAAKACGGNLHKCGGKIFDYGGDFTNGQTLFDAGGTHEENPYEGVQIGTDNEGTPNLVEEGEVQYKDYIFSNRLALTPELCEKYTIPAKFADKTFAYIADKMGDESKERPTDPISKRTLEVNMDRLRNAQEEVRALKEQQEAEKQIEETAEELGITPEEVVEGVQMRQQAEEAAAQQEEMQQAAMEQEAANAEAAGQQPVMTMEDAENAPFALGGTLFDYQGMDYSNPQRTKTVGNNYPRVFMAVNKYGEGGNTDDDGKPKGYVPRSKRSKDFEVKPVHDGEVFEEIADGVLRHHWYRKPEGGYAPELVVAKPGKSTKKGKGVKKAAKPTIAQQLSETTNTTAPAIDNDAVVEAAMAERNSELQNGTTEPSEYESYHSYESVGEPNPKDATTQTENLDTNKRKRAMPNYSILDFVPLYQYLTAGKPDYTQPDALVNYANRIPRLSPKYIGDYMQYHPFDRQYAANQLRAQTAATMRNNVNMSAGNRGYVTAANLAANMQAQLADANMQRQADEANLNQRYTVTNFNRGTNQFNAQTYNNMAVADANLRYPLGLQARSGRMQGHYMIDRDFGQSQSTNLNTWMQNMYNRRREADEKNMINWAAANKVFGNLGGSTPYEEDNSLLGTFFNYLKNRKAKRTNANTTVSG